MPAANPSLCPCGSVLPFSQCCEPLISRQQVAQTPEQLMRSRYSAYFIKNEDYLLDSWHASTRPDTLSLASDTTQWKKLKIISAASNVVEFIAFYTNVGTDREKIFALYEQSHFIKEGSWFYQHGEAMENLTPSKNGLCPCKSGKKFKRCCGIEL